MKADLTYCDFLVLAPLELEVKALETALRHRGWEVVQVETADFPRVLHGRISHSSISHFFRHVVVVQLNHQGVLNASVDTARVLELYEPGYILSFGIAGSFKIKDAPIRSVVLATSLTYYEPSKDISRSTVSRMTPVPIGDGLLNPFRSLPLPNVTRTDGPIASGEKLFADVASHDRKRILAANDKTLAVEMEAAGVGLAVRRLCPFAEFAAIKGISDPADRSKNLASDVEQQENRSAAAANAASCVAELMKQTALRRVFRSIPQPAEATKPQVATSEANLICDALEKYGIRTHFPHLYACLYGRRGPIPAYYHWRQYAPGLHWIDFKILSAIKALPQDLISPVPLVTIANVSVGIHQPWYSCVRRLLGVDPVTDSQIKAQQDEISSYITHIGLTVSAEHDIRVALEELQHTRRPEIMLNLIRFMLGQFCHRRMFVFTWKSNRARWEHLSRAVGIWFSIFEWDTMTLGGLDGKHEVPGKHLLIEPHTYESLHSWLNTSPAPALVQEFVDHFKCHQNSSAKEKVEARMEILNLIETWNALLRHGT